MTDDPKPSRVLMDAPLLPDSTARLRIGEHIVEVSHAAAEPVRIKVVVTPVEALPKQGDE